MVLPLMRRAVSTLTIHGRSLHCSSSVFYIKNYDSKKKLHPKDVEYKPKDKRFLPGPGSDDAPYIKLTEEEMAEKNRLVLEDEIYRKRMTQIDRNSAPFNEVFEGFEDNGKFTQTEIIPDNQERWFWVERLMPINILDKPIREGSQLIAPLPNEAPNLPYFVARTRTRLYPLYRKYVVTHRNHKLFWRNRWDGLVNKYHMKEVLDKLDDIKWENNEKTITVTEIGKIQGDIWKFEEDARKFIEDRQPEGSNLILSSVNEVRGVVGFKGDFVKELHSFLQTSGF